MDEKKKENKTKKEIARRKKRWEKCEYGVPGGSEDPQYTTSVLYCCTNSNIGQRWHLEKWQEYVKAEGSAYGKYINIDHQAYSRFGTYDVYVLNPRANLIECDECPEYKQKKSALSLW